MPPVKNKKNEVRGECLAEFLFMGVKDGPDLLLIDVPTAWKKHHNRKLSPSLVFWQTYLSKHIFP